MKTIGSLLLLIAPSLLLLADPTPAVCEDRLVWSVRIDDGVAMLEENRFGGSKVFPIGEIHLRRRVNLSQEVDGDMRPHLRVDLAPLRIFADGLLGDSETQPLSFTEGWRVAEPREGLKFAVLRLPEEGSTESSASQSCLDLARRSKEKVETWTQLRGSSMAIARTTEGALLFDTSSTDPRGAIPRQLFRRPVRRMAVSESADRVIAVVGEPGRDCLQQIVVHDLSGHLLFEGKPSMDDFDQLHIHPMANVLMFDKRKPGGQVEAMLLDLASYQSRHVEIKRGTRYYSPDGTHMVVIVPGDGRGHFYDLSDPRDPVEKWTYGATDIIITAAIKAGGSLVAFQIQADTSGGHGGQSQVVVLDGGMAEIDFPEGLVRDDTIGLYWSEGYLFRGFQYHPIPLTFNTTRNVSVYDFSDCRARP
jgi:hypothetical protein